MELTLRPAATAGVALTAAALIAVAPVAPPASAIQVLAPRIESEAVQLAADVIQQAVNPAQVYTDLIVNTYNNTSGLAGTLFQQGLTPVLQQLLKNEVFYAGLIGGSSTTGVTIATVGAEEAFVSAIFNSTIPGLANATVALINGDVTGALQDLVGAVTAPPIAFATEVVVGALTVPNDFVTNITTVVHDIVGNIMNVANDIPNTINFIQAILAPPTPLDALVLGTQQAIQNVVTATDPVSLFNAVIAAPGIVLDAVLNGGNVAAPGLLSPASDGGPIDAILLIQGEFAADITPPQLATPAASTVPNAQANTVTLNVAPTTASSTSGSSTPDPTTTPTIKTDKTVTVDKPATQVSLGGLGSKVSVGTPGPQVIGGQPAAQVSLVTKTVTGPLDTALKTVTGFPSTSGKTVGDGGMHHSGKTVKK